MFVLLLCQRQCWNLLPLQQTCLSSLHSQRPTFHLAADNVCARGKVATSPPHCIQPVGSLFSFAAKQLHVGVVINSFAFRYQHVSVPLRYNRPSPRCTSSSWYISHGSSLCYRLKYSSVFGNADCLLDAFSSDTN
uniref:Uncharacterized protein n=1 Tax=Schistocephalus solidus TaxID=70667 RepID=A0A0X3PG17_SCHSO